LELTTSWSSLEMGVHGRNGPVTKSRVSRVNGGIVQISVVYKERSTEKKNPGIESASVDPQECRVILWWLWVHMPVDGMNKLSWPVGAIDP
jgi:hypothetical protein